VAEAPSRNPPRRVAAAENSGMAPEFPLAASNPGPIGRRKRLLFIGVMIFGVPLVSFILLEGGSSLFLLGKDIFNAARIEHKLPITEYDTLLGWANRPGLYLPDHFGPGKHVRINAHGFRGPDLVMPESPFRVRVVCSGDSFTYGDKVGDDDTWCARLASQSPALEVVNMGQRGYGMDQSYLWFRRDGIPLRPDVHLFTFIWDDFTRMQVKRFWGASKPVLRLVGDELQVDNVPVPRASSQVPRLARFGRDVWAALHGLRAYDLAQSFRERMAGPAGIQAPRDSMTWQIAARILRDLAATHKRNGTVFLVVHLAERVDTPGAEGSAATAPEWQSRLRSGSERFGYQFLDLQEQLKQLPPDSQKALFIPPADPHYSEEGHAWVAERLYEYLAAHPALQARLGGR
jgi:hypothetical protein